MRIVKKGRAKFSKYIGRPSIFGNPFEVGVHGTRDECCDMFYTYAWETPAVLEAIQELDENEVLGCFCHPERCHGLEIIAIWHELHGRPQPCYS